MRLLVVRHGIAADRDDWAARGHSDAERPLTDEGRRKMQGVAAGLRTLVPALSLVAASPLVRARETADILAVTYPGVRRAETPVLCPEERPETFEGWVAARQRATSGEEVIAVVGHEPHLGLLTTWLVSGGEGGIVYKKGGAALLEFDGAPRRGRGVLRWLLTPRQLRALA